MKQKWHSVTAVTIHGRNAGDGNCDRAIDPATDNATFTMVFDKDLVKGA